MDGGLPSSGSKATSRRTSASATRGPSSRRRSTDSIQNTTTASTCKLSTPKGIRSLRLRTILIRLACGHVGGTVLEPLGRRAADQGKTDRLDPQSAAPRVLRGRGRLEPRFQADPHQRTSFAVMDSLSDVADQGEFGWTIKRSEDMTALRELAEIASQSGINWLKYPLWNSVSEASSNAPPQISAFFDDLTQRNHAGRPVERSAARAAEPIRPRLDGHQRDFHRPHRVLARVDRESHRPLLVARAYWQLGEEDDESFVGMSGRNLAETIARVKTEFDRIGRDARDRRPLELGDPPAPSRGRAGHLSLDVEPPAAGRE